ncbi:MAG: hypothetical protein LCH59_00790 [Proteobacteria bacterium]|nr:hypothetical protein [Pseudomonadota bacterium]
MSGYFDPFAFLLGGMVGGRGPEPMTNAGRYLRQLERADLCFQRNDEAVSDEMTCALRRIQLTSARDGSA